MELISPILRMDFREFCVSNFVLRQIDDIFSMAGVKRGNLPVGKIISGQRRELVEEYYAGINWFSEADADKFLKVLGYALAQSYITPEAKRLLINCCEKCDLIVDGINVYRKPIIQQGRRVAYVSPQVLADYKMRLLDLDKEEAHTRGFAFERFLNDLFNVYGLAPRGSFRLEGEQIDGSFQLNDDTYLVEAKWQKELTSQKDLLIFREKVESKATWSLGLFVSSWGFSEDGLRAFSRGRATNLIGMTCEDLFFILDGKLPLTEAIAKKKRRAAETGDFYVRVYELLYE